MEFVDVEKFHTIKNDILNYRRTIHNNPEVGDTLPKTKAYVMSKMLVCGSSNKA